MTGWPLGSLQLRTSLTTTVLLLRGRGNQFLWDPSRSVPFRNTWISVTTILAIKLNWILLPTSHNHQVPLSDYAHPPPCSLHSGQVVVVQVMSNSLWLHRLQHIRLPYLSLSPRVCSNSCSLSQWCYSTISSSVTPFSSWPQYFSVFSHKSALRVRWPKYWSFSISSANEYSGLISFRIDQFDLLAAQGTQARNHLKYIWQQTKGSWSMKIICILFPPWSSLWASLTSLMSISNSAVWTECPSLIVL